MALLVNVFIVGGSKDLAVHLSGLTMRVHVIQQLIEVLRANGYPGYEADGVSSRTLVAQRLNDRYQKVYGDANFMPAAVAEAIRISPKSQVSLIQDKVATLTENLQAYNLGMHQPDRSILLLREVYGVRAISMRVMILFFVSIGPSNEF